MIYEFMYRGPIAEEKRGEAFHVVLRIDGKLYGPLTPSQAEARGYTLPAILAELSTQALRDKDAADAAVLRVEAELSAEKTAKQLAITAKAQSDAEVTSLRAQLADAQKGEAVATSELQSIRVALKTAGAELPGKSNTVNRI